MKNSRGTKRTKFEKIAEDYNSPFFRNWLFCMGTSQYKKVLNINGPTMAVSSRNNRIEYFTRMDTWIKAHEDFKNRARQDYRFVEKLIDLANDHGERMNRWTESQIFKASLRLYTSKQLSQLYKKYLEWETLEYTYGVALPILDFQGFSLVENTITSFLKSKVPAEKFPHYFKVFTEPIKNSFSQDQEESLLRIIKKHTTKPLWRKAVLNSNFIDLRSKYPSFYRDLKKHTARFAWVYYGYMGPAFTEHNFLGFVKEYLQKKVDPVKKLKELSEKRLRNNKVKKLYLKQLRPDLFHKSMLRLAGKMVWAKPRRKDYQSKSYYHLEKLQKEIAKRLFVSLEQVRNTPPELLGRALLSNKSIDEVANQVLTRHICFRTGEGRAQVLWGEEARKFFEKEFKKVKETKVFANRVKSLAGQVAFAGKVRGAVKIVNRPQEMGKMKTGDILVSIATTPSIVPAMKKAAAIITDEGGLTCHASIVSREMEIPCVVGLKFATRVFKDGDMVEVDANKGIVRKV